MEEEPLVEEREDLMISPNGGKPFKKTAYFLKSNVPQIIEEEEEEEDGNLKLKLPPMSPKCKWPLKVNFFSWGCPTSKWGKWVVDMHRIYKNLWGEIGIEDAILGSVCKICKNEDLIFNIAERWCPKTNSFLFPWGEATVTLEDVMILGGFSVLGCCPFSLPLQKEEYSVIRNLRKYENSYGQWFNWFMGRRSHVEHEAFLAMWLSMFVFPGNETDKINEKVFPMAVHLAKGVRIALAPALLAGIYRDLTLLNGAMAEASKIYSGEDGGSLEIGLGAPMQLVQVWVWERLVSLRPPKTNVIDKGGPRVIRWHDIEQEDTMNMRPAIDSAGEAFLWRPYALSVDNWALPKYYRKYEEWLPINGKMNDDDEGELESFAKCLRVCELQGIDCKELYQPHRVAMQFGYDQDLPKWIQRPNEFLEFAWYIPFDNDTFLFLPSRLVEADVSYRYMGWWRNRVLVPADIIPGIKRRGRRTRRPALRNSLQNPLAREVRRTALQNSPKGEKNNQASPLKLKCTDTDFGKDVVKHLVKTEPGIKPDDLHPPPGFPPTQHMGKAHVPPRIPKNNLAAMDVAPPPGFLPMGNVPKPIYPPGFPPKKNMEKLDVLPPPGFPARPNFAGFDTGPPGFPLKRKRAVEEHNIQNKA